MAASAPPAGSASAMLLMTVPSCQVLVVQGGGVDRVAAGELSLLQSDSMVFLSCPSAASGDDFSYPLVNQPVLKSDERVYILPAAAGVHYVIYIAAEVAQAAVAAFEEALASCTELRVQGRGAGGAGSPVAAGAAPVVAAPPAMAPPAAAQGQITVASVAGAAHALPTRPSGVHAIASRGGGATVTSQAAAALATGILFAGKVASTAIVAGADIAGKGVSWTATAIKSYVKPATPGSHVRPETIARLEQAHVVSRMAVTVSSGLVASAAAMSRSLAVALSDAVMASKLGDSIRKGGSSNTGQAVKQVAASGLVAFATVWDSMDEAAVVFSANASKGMIGLAEHTHGPEGAVFAQRSLAVAGNVGSATLQMRNLGVAGMVRRTAAETAKELVMHDATLHGAMEITPGVQARGPPALTAAPMPARLALTAGPAVGEQHNPFPVAVPVASAVPHPSLAYTALPVAAVAAGPLPSGRGVQLAALRDENPAFA